MLVQDIKNYIGIDVSKDILDVFILPSRKYMQFNNRKLPLKSDIPELEFSGIINHLSGGYNEEIPFYGTPNYLDS